MWVGPQGWRMIWGYIPCLCLSWVNTSQAGNTPVPAGRRDRAGAPGVPQAHAPHLCGAFRELFDAETLKVAIPEWDTTRSASGYFFPWRAPYGVQLWEATRILFGTDEERHSNPCLPWTSPWAITRISTPLPPWKPYRALTWLDKPITSSPNHHCHVWPRRWQVQGGRPSLTSKPGHGWKRVRRDLTNLACSVFKMHGIFILSCVHANAFIPLSWHKPCFYGEGNATSWCWTLTSSNSASNVRQNF